MKNGYIFILSVISVLLLSLIVSVLIYNQQVATRITTDYVDNFALEEDLRSARSRAISVLLSSDITNDAVLPTTRSSTAGFSNRAPSAGTPDPRLLVDGSPYRTTLSNGSEIFVRIVPITGLVGLDPEQVDKTSAILTQLGVRRSEALELASILADFVDLDDLRRLRGAEARDYPENTAPKNLPLVYASEICGALNWSATTICNEHGRALDLYINLSPNASSNPIFMPDYIKNFLGARTSSLEVSRMQSSRSQIALGRRAANTFDQLGMPHLDAVYAGEFGFPPLGSEFLIIAHNEEATAVYASRVLLTPGNVFTPFESRFDQIFMGDETRRVFNVDANEEIPQLPEADS